MIPRRYIRHPSDIPIEYVVHKGQRQRGKTIADISHGGLSFHTDEYLAVGQAIQLCIPSIRPDLHVEAEVSWCDRTEHGYQAGIRFTNEEDLFTVRMIEQVCYIEAYRQQVLEQEGRKLNSTEAASEWISRFAGDFPEP